MARIRYRAALTTEAESLAAIHAAARLSAAPDLPPLFPTRPAWAGWMRDAFLTDPPVKPEDDGDVSPAYLLRENDDDPPPPLRSAQTRVAVADGQPIGFAVWYCSGWWSSSRRGVFDHQPGHLRMLYVLPGWQGRGIGTRLLSHALARMQEAWFRRRRDPFTEMVVGDRRPDTILWLYRSNRGARRFYERHEFTWEARRTRTALNGRGLARMRRPGARPARTNQDLEDTSP